MSRSTCAFAMILSLAAQACYAQDNAAPVVAAKPGSSPVEIPKLVEVWWHVAAPISSATANRGDTVKLEIDKDVVINGIVVIPRGTAAEGVVSHATKAVPAKKDGVLDVVATQVFMPEGKVLKLRPYLPGEDACGDMGPCWALKAAVVPLEVILFPLVIHKHAEEAKDRRDHPPAGKDMVLTPDSVGSAYTASTFVLHP
jgi:hypothetical protein